VILYEGVAVNARSSLRAEQAAATRTRIREAGAAQFESQGFSGTRIEDIAMRAGVAVPTVYKVFGNKVNLLIGAVEHAMAGDEQSIDRQGWFTQQLDEPDPARQLRLIARNARRMYERAGRLMNVMRDAAPLDPDLVQAWKTIEDRRLERGRASAKRLHAKARASTRLSVNDTAVTLVALTEPQLFATFTAAGRSADRYEAWLADVLVRSLLE
jgi:AcrR family transcriptional regulator